MFSPETGDCRCDGYLDQPLPDPHPCGIDGCIHDGRGDDSARTRPDRRLLR